MTLRSLTKYVYMAITYSKYTSLLSQLVLSTNVCKLILLCKADPKP